MRQRHVSGIEEKLSAYEGLILRPKAGKAAMQLLPNGRPVRWYQRSSEFYALPDGFPRVYVEIGCGRGQFINAIAAEDPGALYIGIEGCKTIVARALEKTKDANLSNVYYIDAFINDAAGAFAEDAITGIYLNFSDPWPKDRHADRRLTSPEKAGAYYKILKPGGFVDLKTDGEAFFDYSLDTFVRTGFLIEDFTRDLKAGETVPTEYEQRFRALGQPIFRFRATKPTISKR